jgi:hypothetical protein
MNFDRMIQLQEMQQKVRARLREQIEKHAREGQGVPAEVARELLKLSEEDGRSWSQLLDVVRELQALQTQRERDLKLVREEHRTLMEKIKQLENDPGDDWKKG